MILLYKFFYEYVHIKWMLYLIIFNKGILSSNILLSLFCGFRNAYNMILHKFGEKLHSGLVATMTFHVKKMARSLEATQGSSFLEELNTKWNDHNEALRMIRDIMMYADMTYFPQIMRTRVYELGLNLWRENVIYSNQIRTRISNTLLEFVFKEHAAEDVNREQIRNLSKMLMDLGPSVYEKEFETPFLQVSGEFYRAESQKFVEFSDCRDYLKKTAKQLNEEMNRLSYLLDKREDY
jgi:cullin 3